MLANILLVLAVASLFFGSTYVMPTFVGTFLAGVACYFLSKIKSVKIVAVNLLILFISLFFIELFFKSSVLYKDYKRRNNKTTFVVIDRKTKKEINDSKSYIKTLHDELGYGPMPDTIINAKKIRKGKVVYDVNYNIDENGHRIASVADNWRRFKKSILFFGCSFTYGEGVQDDESMPYIFNLETRNKYKVSNFGFSGYGAHQMLAILQNNIEKNAIKNGEVEHVFYQAILDHVNRAVFTSHPKYILDEENNLRLVAKANDLRQKNSKSKNLILQKLNNVAKRDRSDINDRDRDLFLQIVKESRDLVEEKYKAKFTVILWDLIKNNNKLVAENKYNLDYITHGLDEFGIKYVLISEILDDHDVRSWQYTISGDGHPSPLAHKKIAQYLLNNIINL